MDTLWELIVSEWNYLNNWMLGVGLVISTGCFFYYKKTHSRPLLTCLPGVWTSLGLLGTFIAICLSLHDLKGDDKAKDSQGEKSGEVVSDNSSDTISQEEDNPATDSGVGKTVKEDSGDNINIINIIRQLIPAFTTSILGLFAALIFTILAKIIFAKEDKAEDEKLGNHSPEEYLMSIQKHSVEACTLLKSIVNAIIAQDKKTAQYNAALNDNISSQNKTLRDFIDGFVSRMDDIFQRMHGAIEQQVKTFGEEQFTKTSQVLTTLTDQMSAAATQIMDTQRQSVADTLAETNQAISELTQEVTSVLKALGAEQGERLNSLIGSYDELATTLSGQNATFATQMNTQMQQQYADVQQHNVESLEQMVDLRDAFQETATAALNDAQAKNAQLLDDMHKQLGGFVGDLQASVTQQCDALGKAISDNVAALDTAFHFVKDLIAEIRQNYDQAVLAYTDAVNVAHRSNETAERTIAATNDSLKEVEQTNRKVAQVLDELTARGDNLESLAKQIDAIGQAVQTLRQLENTLNKIAAR